jgi:hypothetical protein
MHGFRKDLLICEFGYLTNSELINTGANGIAHTVPKIFSLKKNHSSI